MPFVWSFILLLLLPINTFSQTMEKPVIPNDVLWEPDIEYLTAGAKAVNLAMDVVTPKGSGGPYPVVVCIHGGGFRKGERQSQLPLCIKLAKRGYVAATISYRLSPRDQFPAPVLDVKTAIRFLRANAVRFNIDPAHIGVTGFSAGGHLALFLGLTAGVPEFEGPGPYREQSSKVQCVVNFYGPTDFTKSYEKSVDAAEVLPLFLGGDLEHERLAHIQASPLNWVSPNASPVLTIQGTEDRYVAYEQAVWITERLRSAGVESELLTLEGAGHGFKGADAEKAEKRLIEFMDSHLKAQPERQLLIADHGPGAEILAISWPSGKVLWRTPNQRGRDVQALANHHALFTMDFGRRVVEVDADQHVIWTYGAAEGLEQPVAAQRLRNGNTMIADGKSGKIIEVDSSGKIVWEYQNADIGNMRMRSVRPTAQDTFLIAIEAVGKIIEVNRSGQIIWSYEVEGGNTRFPYQAHRLENGNTLISLAEPGGLVEVDSAGKTVRTIAGNKMDLRFGWVTGTQPLPDGGLIVADYTGKRLVELDSTGRVVHELRNPVWNIASISLVP